jgi:hypothetical protein
LIEALLIANNEEEYKGLKGRSQRIIPRIREQYLDLFNHPMPKFFGGCEMGNILKLAVEKYDLKFIIYSMKKDENKVNVKYEQLEIIGSTRRVVNLLLLSNKTETHICYIKNIEGLTKCHICPKCNNYMLSAFHNKNYHKEYFEKHVEKCDGKIHVNLK